jgi:hypothetical protein
MKDVTLTNVLIRTSKSDGEAAKAVNEHIAALRADSAGFCQVTTYTMEKGKDNKFNKFQQRIAKAVMAEIDAIMDDGP